MRSTLIAASVAALGLCVSAASADHLIGYNFDEALSGTADTLDNGAAPASDGVFNLGATRTINTPSGTGAALDVITDGYVGGGDPAKLDDLTAGTFAAWINIQGTVANGNRILAKQDTAAANFDGFSFAFSTPNAGAIAADNVAINLAAGDSGAFGFNISSTDFDASDKWVFVVATFDGSTGAVDFLLGDANTPVSSLGSTLAGGTNPATLGANDSEFRVGASSSSTTSAEVLIDDIKVWGRVLTPSELDAVRLSNVPEPASLGLIGLGGLTLLRRRKA